MPCMSMADEGIQRNNVQIEIVSNSNTLRARDVPRVNVGTR